MLTKIMATRQEMLIVTLMNSGRVSLHFSFGLHSEKHSGELHGVCSLQAPWMPFPRKLLPVHILNNLEVVIAEGWKQ